MSIKAMNINGLEIIATVEAEDEKTITLKCPRQLAITPQGMALMPFVWSATDSETIVVRKNYLVTEPYNIKRELADHYSQEVSQIFVPAKAIIT